MPTKKITEKKETKKTQTAVKTKTATVAGKLSVSIMDLSGKKVGTVSLPAGLFGAKINPELMAQSVRVYLANQRQGNGHAKTRGEVRGSRKKVWRQKGTGRARHGSITGPIFVGGGITFGPRTRDFSLDMPKKMKKAALSSALSAKMQDSKVLVLDEAGLKDKTKQLFKALKSLELLNKKQKVDNILLLTANGEKSVYKIGKNIEGLSVESVKNMNTYEVLRSKNLIFLKSAIEDLKKQD